jgi:hypothetical protein
VKKRINFKLNPNPIYSTPFLNKIRSYCVKSSYTYSSSYVNNQFISLVPSITDFYYTITSDNLELFSLFPKDICHLIFKDYIPFSLPKDSIYATLVTAILENKIIPLDIFHQCLRCHNYPKFTCSQTSTHCCYSYSLTHKTSVPEHYRLSFISFKNFSLNDLMNVFVKDKI